MSTDPGVLLFIQKSLDVRVLAIRQDTNKDVGVDDLTSIGINDLGRIASPINLDLFTWLPRDVHRCSTLLLILLDIITELRIHQRIIAVKTAVLKILSPQELLVHTVAEQFLPDIVIIRHSFGRRRTFFFPWE